MAFLVRAMPSTNGELNMHKLTVQTCAEYLVAAYTAVGDELQRELGLKVRVGRKQAPSSLEGLKQDAEDYGVLFVSDEHCDTSMYGVGGNIKFRIMHDLGHLSTGLQMTCADEVALALHQWEQVRLRIPPAWRERCQAVYQADTIMQSLYCERHGTFPSNQTEFVHAALAAYN